MLLIIEGPDGAGKTTLIERLRCELKRYFWILRPAQPPDNSAQIRSFLEFLESKPEQLMVICDRHPLVSEPIYGPLLRQVNHLEVTSLTLAGHLNRVTGDTIVIYCRPPFDTIRENVIRTRDLQLEGVPENFEKIIQHYDFWYGQAHKTMNILTYNYTVPNSYEDILTAIQDSPL